MSIDAVFKQALQKNLATLEQFVPVVARVHGSHRPEFLQVRAVFDELNAEIKKTGADKAYLGGLFESLRVLTGNYTVPSDVCESYEAVYAMLAELDTAYTAGRPENG